MSESVQNIVQNIDQTVHDAMGNLSVADKFNLWKQFHTIAQMLDFDIRETRLGCEMRPSFHPTSGWHLSTCVYPDKGDCSCWFMLSHPTYYFAREKARVSHVLNKGLHWGYCPLSKIACDDLITLDTDKQFDCKCLVDLNPSIPQEYLKEKHTNDAAEDVSNEKCNSLPSNVY
ncbi:hypothetical protein AVEN_79186-1 [Araneus ventricosus]|uniref:Uncharacterized protein n=1 Tax=Araneus ventricosus TaxID=182803 RepID=A0A4Y2FKK6_ARAVE|nr:hypothetical protein AVEN_79186-1 [Araneus ventricosus]